MTHLALRLLILTGVRSHPLRFLHLDQIEGDVWTIPGERLKGRRDATTDFRVPLSTELHSSARTASINSWAQSRSRTLVYHIAFFFAPFGLDADRAALLGTLV